MKFMLLFIANEDEWMTLPEEERQAAIGRIGAWYGEHARDGKFVEARRLHSGRQAATVRLGPGGRSGEPKLSDGPFFAAPEAIGSYAIVEVAGRDEAVAIARSWPGGGAVEVRHVMEE